MAVAVAATDPVLDGVSVYGRPMRVWRFVSGVFIMLVVAVTVLVLLATVAAPRIMGWVPLVVASGSMEPHVRPGDLIISKPVDPQNAHAVRVGDVLTFETTVSNSANLPTAVLVTHRVVNIGVDAVGAPAFIVRGDANNADDPSPVMAAQVRAVELYDVPLMGYVTRVVPSDAKPEVVTVLAGCLVGFGVLRLAQLARHERRSKLETTLQASRHTGKDLPTS